MAASGFSSLIAHDRVAAEVVPDGKQLAFYDPVQGQNARLRTISVDGGTPTEQLWENPESKLDADWSADGTEIVFGNGTANPDSTIQLLDWNTNRLSALHDSKRPVLPALVSGWPLPRRNEF